MVSIAQQLVSDLPSDPNRSLLELRNRIINYMKTNEAEDDNLRQIIAVVKIWHGKFGNAVKWKIPNYQVKDNHLDIVNGIVKSLYQFELEVNSEIAAQEAEEILNLEEQIRNKDTFGIAVLSAGDKEEIRVHIANIRSIINDIDLPERKRIALLERLAQLEKELETLGTRTDRFFAFMGDAAFALGDFATKAKPFTDEVKSILKIVLKGRENTEGMRLPKRTDDMLLPPPDDL